MDVTEWGPEGYVVCQVCGKSYACHLWAWGHPDTTGYCNNCGAEGRTCQWMPGDWPEPEYVPVEPALGWPNVN